MLKLEKIAKTLEISITLRQRERIWSKAFVQALIIAIGLHIFAGLLFNVRLAKIMGSQTVFAPILVESDLSTLPDNSVIAQLDTDEVLPRHIKEPKGSKPALPSIPVKPGFGKDMHLNRTCDSDCDTFQALEAKMYNLEFSLSLPSTGSSTKPVIIQTSGRLDHENLVTEGWENMDLSPLSTLANRSYRKTYNVRIENKTGCAFWFEPDCPGANDSSLDSLAENILKNMRFETKENAFVTAGTIEIIFYGQGPKG